MINWGTSRGHTSKIIFKFPDIDQDSLLIATVVYAGDPNYSLVFDAPIIEITNYLPKIFMPKFVFSKNYFEERMSKFIELNEYCANSVITSVEDLEDLIDILALRDQLPDCTEVLSCRRYLMHLKYNSHDSYEVSDE